MPGSRWRCDGAESGQKAREAGDRPPWWQKHESMSMPQYPAFSSSAKASGDEWWRAVVDILTSSGSETHGNVAKGAHFRGFRMPHLQTWLSGSYAPNRQKSPAVSRNQARHLIGWPTELVDASNAAFLRGCHLEIVHVQHRSADVKCCSGSGLLLAHAVVGNRHYAQSKRHGIIDGDMLVRSGFIRRDC
jgi:hypothetical protein